MRTIYLDHAATSFPKPPAVGKRMQEYVETVGATVNRSRCACGKGWVRCSLFPTLRMWC